MPKVSVIMGVYNANKPFLEKAINSILTQSYTDFEFIICDDGSSDDTYEYVKKLIDYRCILIKNEKNVGLAQTLNNCIDVASGEYIARMDADDISLKDRFLNQVSFLDNHRDVAVVGTQAYFIDENGKRYKKFCRKNHISLSDTVKNSNIIHPSVMIRKEALNSVGNYTVSKLTTRAEDYDLWCKLAYSGYKLRNLNDFLFEYREDLSAYKKRKYKHRIEEFKIKYQWINKASNKKIDLLYAFKPLLVGLIPKFIMIRRKIR